MTVKHTPGPWRVEVDTDPEASWERKWPTINAEKYEVVGCEGFYGDYETDMANARLIVAAPYLLDALSRLTEMYCQMVHSGDCGNWNPEDDIEIQEARAAIAKATEKKT